MILMRRSYGEHLVWGFHVRNVNFYAHEARITFVSTTTSVGLAQDCPNN